MTDTVSGMLFRYEDADGQPRSSRAYPGILHRFARQTIDGFASIFDRHWLARHPSPVPMPVVPLTTAKTFGCPQSQAKKARNAVQRAIDMENGNFDADDLLPQQRTIRGSQGWRIEGILQENLKHLGDILHK